ncbi:MAG: uroporphyrinogen decarboxylase family protein [Planctomycetota bacterium]
MNSRERVIAALEHEVPDRVPFDLGSTYVTGITKNAYLRLAELMGSETSEVELCDVVQQLAVVSEEMLERLEVDVRGVVPNIVRRSPPLERVEGGEGFNDEWGVTWKRPEGGLYFDIVASPFSGEVSKADIEDFPWPDAANPALFEGLAEQAENHYDNGYAVVLENICAGIFEMCCRVRGAEQFYMDLAMNPDLAERLMDKFVELKIAYFEKASEILGEYVQLVREVDDMAGQEALLVSPAMYRDLIKPRHKRLFDAQRKLFPQPFYIFFHSDGAIYDIIPDFVEIGVDILNPVQLTAKGMDAKKLKREFGKTITFWGGGVDTQNILPHATPEQVKANVQERLANFAPGGGFVFATVHNIQGDVPAENIAAMIEAFREAREY